MSPIVFTAIAVIACACCAGIIVLIPARRRRKAFASFASANGFIFSPRRPELSEQSFFTLPFMLDGKALGGINNVVEGTVNSTPFIAFDYMFQRRVLGRSGVTYHFTVVVFPRNATNDLAISVQPSAPTFLPDLGMQEVPGLLTDSHRRVLVSDLEEFQNTDDYFRDVFERVPTLCCDISREWMVVYPIVVVKSFRLSLGSPTDVRVAPAELNDFLNQAHVLFRSIEGNG